MPSSYVSNFVVDENPLSQGGGKWITGLTGGLWTAPKVLSGVACASKENTNPDDSIAVADPATFTLGNDYYIAAKVRRAAGYVPSDGHEVELHVNKKILSGDAPGLELTFPFNSDANSQNVELVRWEDNPNQNQFTVLTITVTGGFQILGGDELAVRKAGNNFFIYHNDFQICTFAESTFAFAGGPGIGFFMRPLGTPEAYGFTGVSITAGANTAFVPSQVFAAATRSFTISNLDPSLSLFKCALSRESWPVGSVGSVSVEAAVDGVNFKNVGGTALAGGNFTFKGRTVTHTRIFCGIPGQGQSGRAARITFQNSVSLQTAPIALLF